jgi:hypothetical protein
MFMEKEFVKFSLTYLPANVRMCYGVASRGGNDLNNMAEDIFSSIMMLELAAWTEIMPIKKLRRKCYSKIDTTTLPIYAYNDCVSIRDFLKGHGELDDSAPSVVMAIAMVNCGIWMKRMAITAKDYDVLIRKLDTTPPESFANFIEICMQYKKEMKE